jgi:AcrR family transcriptional regulator
MHASTCLQKGVSSVSSTDEKILEAACDLFAAKGYKGVSTRELAEAARVNESTLFRRFSSKENIFSKIIEKFFRDRSIAFDNLELTYNLDHDLMEMSDGIFQYYYKYHRTLKILLKDAPKPKPENKDQCFEGAENEFRNFIFNYFTEMNKRNMIDDEPEKTTMFFLTNVNGYLMHNMIFHHKSIKSYDTMKEEYNWIISKVIKAINI